MLTNPGFEDPILAGGDIPGAVGWTSFGNTFTIKVAPHSGDNALKMFGGCCSRVFQQFAINPGETGNGGAWVLNPSFDALAGGQVGAVNIEWIQADGSTQSTITPFISNGMTDANQPLGDQPSDYVLRTVTGVAPADAAFGRFVLITGDFAPGGPGGAPFYDDAFYEVLPVPEPSSMALGTLGLMALRGLARRRDR